MEQQLPGTRGKLTRMWLKRVGWMLLIWSLSVGFLGICALLMRMLMHLMGMS